jgi:hypothetical protein
MAYEPKVTKAEERLLSLIPDVATRAQAQAALLAQKQANVDRVQNTRSIFEAKLNATGTHIVLSGMGYRFPVTILPQAWVAIKANVAAIDAIAAQCKKAPGK